jgi:hypothetical protein
MEQSQWINIDDVEWDDVVWPEEPRKTYSEAIQDLQNQIRARGDVRVDWQGGRGVRGDARVVFLGGVGISAHRVRFRSADQLGVFTRILRSACPLPEHQGLWSKCESVITALVACDYDELIFAVTRTMVPKVKRKDAASDSPLGRDMHGLLATTGVFGRPEPEASSKSGRRAMRLVLANDELETLYPRRFRATPSVALELEGFEAADAEAAQKLLVDYGTSFLHQIVRAAGVSLRIWMSSYPTRRHSLRSRAGKIRFPRERYDSTPAELYAAANSSGRDPLERYLKYYQVLEFYMPRAAAMYAAAQGRALGSEKDKLDAIVDMAITPAQLEGFFRGNDLLAGLAVQIHAGDHVSQQCSRCLASGCDWRGGQRYFELGRPLLSLWWLRCSAGGMPEESHTQIARWTVDERASHRTPRSSLAKRRSWHQQTSSR